MMRGFRGRRNSDGTREFANGLAVAEGMGTPQRERTGHKKLRTQPNTARNRKRPARTFVFAVAGERHVEAVETALAYLKAFSRAEVVVFQTAASRKAKHDQVVTVEVPEGLDDHRASILLKTSLTRRLHGRPGTYCYIDSDVIAVDPDVDSIFLARSGAINFAQDHVDIDGFSRWAVRCGCASGRCEHLRSAILRKFHLSIPMGNWRLWNGGVFLFDHDSQEFLESWHKATLSIFDDPYWRTRDQGTLAATVWKSGLQTHAPLDGRFNFIVDRMWGIPPERRASATAKDFHVRDDYAIQPREGVFTPSMIHFVNGGVGQKGWRHWDEVAALLPEKSGRAPGWRKTQLP